jgi:DNA polymerase-3 subunit chi
MSEVWFYHLERQSLEEALPTLLEKCLERKWRALVQVGDEGAIERLDQHLWTYKDETFLPHARAGSPDAARQPVLLSADGANLNSAQALFLVLGAPFESVGSFERVMLLFDGGDDAALQAARQTWKKVKAEGLSAAYWKQNERGQWSKEAQ